jgi:hypothetical protein
MLSSNDSLLPLHLEGRVIFLAVKIATDSALGTEFLGDHDSHCCLFTMSRRQGDFFGDLGRVATDSVLFIGRKADIFCEFSLR